jgi:hypothetical protein
MTFATWAYLIGSALQCIGIANGASVRLMGLALVAIGLTMALRW